MRDPAEPDYELVMVQWVDHVEHTGWTPIEAVFSNSGEGHTIWSVGWLIKEGKKSILVCPHLSVKPSEEATGTMEILVEAIKSIHVLKY